MLEVGFYHLTTSTLEQTLPRLLEKVVARNQRAVLRIPMPERLEALDRWLWSYTRDSFLPHGTRSDGFPEWQPIWLTTGADNPNGADVLVLVDGAPLEPWQGYGRIVDFFDGNDPEALEAARERWRSCREAGHKLVYWQQTERGGWRIARQVEGREEAASAP